MGVGSSRNVMQLSVTNETINKSIMNFNPSTVSNSSALNYIEVGAGGLAQDNTQAIEMKTNLQSMYEATQNSDFASTMNSNVSQDLEKKSVAFLSDLTGLLMNKDTIVNTALTNHVENINIENIAPLCISNQDLTNSIIIKAGGAAIGNKQTITGDFYQSCMGSVASSMNSIYFI